VSHSPTIAVAGPPPCVVHSVDSVDWGRVGAKVCQVLSCIPIAGIFVQCFSHYKGYQHLMRYTDPLFINYYEFAFSRVLKERIMYSAIGIFRELITLALIVTAIALGVFPPLAALAAGGMLILACVQIANIFLTKQQIKLLPKFL